MEPWRTPSASLSSASLPARFALLPRSSEHCRNTAKLRRRSICCSSAPRINKVNDCEAPKVEVRPPPSDYDFRAETSTETRDTVRSLHPELMDLVEDGTLVIVKRAPHYVERRSNGYVEPEVVYIVGTAHMSRLSADQMAGRSQMGWMLNRLDGLTWQQHSVLKLERRACEVTRVINCVHPDNVVIELCRSRAGIMYDEPTSTADVKPGSSSKSNLMSMSGDSFGSAVGRSLKLGGRSALALRLLLAGVSRRLSTSAGVATGEEFRAARKAAEAIGAQIVLGDRPIEITLQRAWRSLRWDERFRFAVTLLQGMSDKNLDVSEESLQALKSDDALSAMFGELSSRFPSLLQPLVHERDMYLAWSLKRSKAVNGCKRVVGVVGKGHLRGVVHALRHDQQNLRFKDLVGARATANGHLSRTQQLQKLTKNLAIETAVGLLLWWAWDSIQHH